MASSKLTLRCQSKTGQHILGDLTSTCTVGQLKEQLSRLTHISANSLRIRHGFPPRVIDTTDNSRQLSSLPLRSGDTLVVEEDNISKTHSQGQRVDAGTLLSEQLIGGGGILTRKVVPADNSCLFTSINTLLTDGTVDCSSAKQMRELIAAIVMSDPQTYTTSFLGKPNADYCKWIRSDDAWGGGIELHVLSQHYGIEIDVVDTQSGRVSRFGEDKSYNTRILLIYDGIHYDPLVWESVDGSQHIELKFPTSDDEILIQAQELAAEAKASRQYTDVSSFSLCCLVCQMPLKGAQEAEQHAKSTGHINFGEI